MRDGGSATGGEGGGERGRECEGGSGDRDAGARHLLARVRDRLADRAADARDPRVTVGDRVLAVEVTLPESGAERAMGLAHRPSGEPAAAIGADGEATVARLAAAATDASAPIDRAVGVATLNALSVPDVDWRVGDPMADLPSDVSVVATVGLFRPAFRKFADVTVRVVEREPPAPARVDAPPSVAVETYGPADCERAFEGADVCFLTGSTLVYGGIDRYLTALSAAGVAPVVLVGATASHLPGPAFDAGVGVVAGARVRRGDRDRVRDRIRAGDCGTDLHDAGVQKVYAAAPAGSTGTEPGESSEPHRRPDGTGPDARPATVLDPDTPDPKLEPDRVAGNDCRGAGSGARDLETETETEIDAESDTEVTDA